MDININFRFFSDRTEEIINQLTNIGNKMATLQDIKNELTGITDAVTASNASFDLLVAEVRQLIAQGNLAGADELLVQIQSDKAAILNAVAANTALASEVDAVNGDPAVI